MLSLDLQVSDLLGRYGYWLINQHFLLGLDIRTQLVLSDRRGLLGSEDRTGVRRGHCRCSGNEPSRQPQHWRAGQRTQYRLGGWADPGRTRRRARHRTTHRRLGDRCSTGRTRPRTRAGRAVNDRRAAGQCRRVTFGRRSGVALFGSLATSGLVDGLRTSLLISMALAAAVIALSVSIYAPASKKDDRRQPAQQVR
jgi:hypothetical protein